MIRILFQVFFPIKWFRIIFWLVKSGHAIEWVAFAARFRFPIVHETARQQILII